MRRSALRIRLIKLLTAIDILTLKLYIRNKRAENRIATLLSINKELQLIENRINETLIKVKIENRYWMITQINNIAKIPSKK